MRELIVAIGLWVTNNAVWLKISSAIFSSLLFIRIIFYAVYLEKFSEPVKDYLDFSGRTDKFVKKRTNKAWRSIVAKFNAGDQANLKLALIEADRILEMILKNAGFPGENLDERLQKAASVQIPNILDVREAHEGRNKVFSDPAYTITKENANRFLRAYQEFFSYIGFLG